jgi:hypothetical protein
MNRTAKDEHNAYIMNICHIWEFLYCDFLISRVFPEKYSSPKILFEIYIYL